MPKNMRKKLAKNTITKDQTKMAKLLKSISINHQPPGPSMNESHPLMTGRTLTVALVTALTMLNPCLTLPPATKQKANISYMKTNL